VRLASGTDAAIAPAKPPGILPEASSSSSPPVEALASATSAAARAYGLRDRKGRLRTGMTPTCCWSTGTRWRISVRCAASLGGAARGDDRHPGGEDLCMNNLVDQGRWA